MKIIIVHNSYGKFSGEEAVVRDTFSTLEKHGHKVVKFQRSSEEIQGSFSGSVKAFFCGIFNPFSRTEFKKILFSEKPDLIHIHNLYPLISPSILFLAKQLNFPVVMTVHNYRLICPNGLFYSHGEICERCQNGKEYWCVLRNCESNWFKSLGYTLRNWFARKRRGYLNNVTRYACLTTFQKNKLVSAGYSVDRIQIIPNMVQSPPSIPPASNDAHVAFIGRLTEEKGITVLIEAAKQCPDIQFVAAGSYDSLPGLESKVPKNFRLLGHCDVDMLAGVYQQARFIVLPSIWYEGFPTVLVEAMLHGKPIICSRIGGLPDIVDDEKTGLLFTPGDSRQLAEKIKYLWDNPEISRMFGEAGKNKALTEYSEQQYYSRLMDLYSKAMEACKN